MDSSRAAARPSSIPPSSDRRSFLRDGDSYSCATPRELKKVAIDLQFVWKKLAGVSKRKTAEFYGRPWSTVRGWLNPRHLDCTPPREFVEWLALRVKIARLEKAFAGGRR